MPKEFPLSFYHSSRMHWWPAANVNRHVDEVLIGAYDVDGGGVGPHGEFAIRWVDLAPHFPTGCARLDAFEDAWGALGTPQGKALVEWLIGRHGTNPTPAEVCAFLRSIGCRDNSDRPDADRRSGAAQDLARDIDKDAARAVDPDEG